MKVKLTYTEKTKQTDKNILGYRKVTKLFTVKKIQKLYNLLTETYQDAYHLENGWYVSPVSDGWEITKGEEHISICELVVDKEEKTTKKS